VLQRAFVSVLHRATRENVSHRTAAMAIGVLRSGMRRRDGACSREPRAHYPTPKAASRAPLSRTGIAAALNRGLVIWRHPHVTEGGAQR
jgi:hypothetical protein